MIICSILITKQLISCGQCKENLQTDKVAGADKVNATLRGKKEYTEKPTLRYLGFVVDTECLRRCDVPTASLGNGQLLR